MANGKRSKLIARPKGCLTPNEVGKRLGCTGVAVKRYILQGKLRAAKAPNGYWWVKGQDLDKFLAACNALKFKYHRGR